MRERRESVGRVGAERDREVGAERAREVGTARPREARGGERTRDEVAKRALIYKLVFGFPLG